MWGDGGGASLFQLCLCQGRVRSGGRVTREPPASQARGIGFVPLRQGWGKTLPCEGLVGLSRVGADGKRETGEGRTEALLLSLSHREPWSSPSVGAMIRLVLGK